MRGALLLPMRPVLLGSLRQHLDLHCVLRLCTTVYTAVRHCSYLQGLAAPLVPLRFRCPTLYLLPRRTCVPRDLSSTPTSYSQQHYFFMRCPGRGLREMLSAETVRCFLAPRAPGETFHLRPVPLQPTSPLYGCCQLHAATAPASVVCLRRPGAAAKGHFKRACRAFRGFKGST